MNHNTDHIGRMAATLIDGKLHQSMIVSINEATATLASGITVSLRRLLVLQ